jgi:hypothetical protein
VNGPLTTLVFPPVVSRLGPTFTTGYWVGVGEAAGLPAPPRAAFWAAAKGPRMRREERRREMRNVRRCIAWFFCEMSVVGR